MNKVIFMGRIASELEQKTTPNGIPVCSFRLAVDRNYQKKGEEKVTDFFNIVCWRATAEFVTRYFGKGRMILIEGELHNNNYTDKNGNTVYGMEVVAERISFTGEKANEGQGQGGYQGADYGYQQNNYGGVPQQSAPQQTSTPNAPTDFGGASDDNYPF